MGDLEFVRVDPDDQAALGQYRTASSMVFLQAPPTDAQLALTRAKFAGQRLVAARDGDRVVGTFRSYDTGLTVPGGQVTANAISNIAVLPTHRRRGLLTRWMTGELDRARDSGAPVSILIASQAPIYGRFGFGVATRVCTWTLDCSAARWRDPAPGVVEIVDPETWAAQAAELYERARVGQPGAIDRSAIWWTEQAQVRRIAGVDVREPEDPQRVRVLCRDEAGQVQGAAAYRVHAGDDDRWIQARLEIRDMVTATEAARQRLWRYFTEVDLVTSVTAAHRSPAESLPWALIDLRGARSGAMADLLWVRLHDVPAVLQARRYPVPGRLVLGVDDPLGQVGGRYELDVAADGTATCTTEPDGPVDVTLGVDGLASLWLGGTTVAELAGAGRLSASMSVRGLMGAMFSWPEPAWCGTWF